MTANNKVELKPCPFCGSKPHRSGTLITCSNLDCFADMNDNRIGQFDPTYVIEAWNLRSSSGDARVLDELEKWIAMEAWPNKITAYGILEKLRELRTTVKEEKK